MSVRHHFLPRGFHGPRTRHPGQCIILDDGPRRAQIAGVSGNTAIIDADICAPVGARIEILHPVAGLIVGNVVEKLARGVAVAFNAGDRAVSFALAALARDLRTAR